MKSDGMRDDGRLDDLDRLLNSFMRLVERVRRNWMVKSRAQFSGSGCSIRGCGTGFRRGTPLLPDIVATAVSSAERGCGCRSGEVVEDEVFGVLWLRPLPEPHPMCSASREALSLPVRARRSNSNTTFLLDCARGINESVAGDG